MDGGKGKEEERERRRKRRREEREEGEARVGKRGGLMILKILLDGR